MGENAQAITIEKASLQEAKHIYEIGTLCFQDAWRLETVIHDMEGSQSTYFVAKSGDKVLGYGCFWFVADEGQLVNIGVRPEERRKGIAKKILEAGIEESKKRGMATLFLEVRVSNISAQELYRKYDFKVLGLRKNVYEYPVEDGYIMSRHS